jgi:hypothetical protein
MKFANPLQEKPMNARTTIPSRTLSSALFGSLVALASFNASAQSTATLDPSLPIPATLMPEMKVTASASRPYAAPRWSLASTRPVAVTLMPTLTIRPDVDSLAVTVLPTVTVVASLGTRVSDSVIVHAVASLPADVSYQLAD